MYTEAHLPVTKGALIPQGGITGGLHARNILGKEAFKVMASLGNVATGLGFDEP